MLLRLAGAAGARVCFREQQVGLRRRWSERHGALEMRNGLGGLAGVGEGAPEPEVGIGGGRMRGDGAFEIGDRVGATALPDQELAVPDRRLRVGAAAESDTLAVFLLRRTEPAERFEGFGAREPGSPRARVGVLQRGESVVEAIERVEGASVEEAGVRDLVVEAAGAAECFLGFRVLLQSGVSHAESLPLLRAAGVGLGGATEQRQGGREFGLVEQSYALVVVSGLCEGAKHECSECSKQPRVYYIDVRYAAATLIVLCAVGAAGGWFEDASAKSGIEFTLLNSATPEKRQIESMPGGVAAFDYNNDGRADLFFANGAKQPSLEKTDPSFFNRLYRNVGGGAFEDVTEKAGVRGAGYSVAAATADYDNDGFADLFVAGVNRNILYHNRGDGTFEDVTAKAGVANQGRWAVSAGWFDYDNDGRLDLMVVNYVKWDPPKEPFCGDAKAGYRSYCHPKFYEGLPNTLYRNNGDGTFTDVSDRAGIAKHVGKGMGVAFADYDGDGAIDMFVANDTVPNFLFHNERNGTFREVAMQAGVAMNDDGRALSSMGVDFRDVDNDGLPDLFVTALTN